MYARLIVAAAKAGRGAPGCGGVAARVSLLLIFLSVILAGMSSLTTRGEGGCGFDAEIQARDDLVVTRVWRVTESVVTSARFLFFFDGAVGG